MRLCPRQPRPRRGATWPAIIWALCVGGTVVTTAVVVTPRYLRADSTDPGVPARVTAHQQVFDAFAGLVSRSKEVVAVNQRGATPFLEFVLWLEDKEHLGVIDPQEIAVVTHSEVLQTITVHSLEPASKQGGDALFQDETVEPPKTLERSDMREPGFCARFRDQPDVVRRLLATGVARLHAEPHFGAVGRPMLRISLIWDQESADGGDEASALMDVHMRSDDGAQTE